jgi:hypothetical protein
MSGFSAEWLELREPFDAAARSATLSRDLRARLDLAAHSAPLPVVDLGAGAGSNVRHLAPLLGGTQQWRLVDHDAALLEAALAITHRWAKQRGARVEQRGDVLHVRATHFACALRCEQRDLDAIATLELPESGLVTAAALLDLVSAQWLETLVHRCAAARARILFALTYDGRTLCMPPEPHDAVVLASFNRHQLKDKGLGPALGPGAPRAAEAALLRAGYEVATAPSDWLIDAHAHEMQHALLDGWYTAALELDPGASDELSAWRARRRAHVSSGRSTLRVGHVDLAAWLR